MEKKQRIGTSQALLLVTVAFLIDSVQLLLGLLFIGLGLNTIISILAGFSFFLWFKLLHIDFFDSLEKTLLSLGAGIVEFIPFANGFFTWTVVVIRMVIVVRREDARYNKKHEDSVQKIAATI